MAEYPHADLQVSQKYFYCTYQGKEMETISIIPRKAFKSRTGWSFLSSGKIPSFEHVK